MTTPVKTVVSGSTLKDIVKLTPAEQEQLYTVIIVPEFDAEQKEITDNKEVLSSQMLASSESGLSAFSL